MSSNLKEFNDHDFIVLNNDSYIDLVERYGEPSSVIFRHVDFNIQAVAKFEEVRNFDVVYISFSHINSNFLNQGHMQNEANPFSVPNGAYRQAPRSNTEAKDEIKYYKDSEKSFMNHPELWIARSYDIRPLKYNDSGPLPLKREQGMLYILFVVGVYLFF